MGWVTQRGLCGAARTLPEGEVGREGRAREPRLRLGRTCNKPTCNDLVPTCSGSSVTSSEGNRGWRPSRVFPSVTSHASCPELPLGWGARGLTLTCCERVPQRVAQGEILLRKILLKKALQAGPRPSLPGSRPLLPTSGVPGPPCPLTVPGLVSGTQPTGCRSPHESEKQLSVGGPGRGRPQAPL